MKTIVLDSHFPSFHLPSPYVSFIATPAGRRIGGLPQGLYQSQLAMDMLVTYYH